jgi:hypothetical protein
MASHCGVKQVGLLTLVCLDLTRSALEKRHPCFLSFFIIMAYNREWDMGKEEAWHDDGGPWSGNGRDEDYGEGKKRKFNGGVRRLLLRRFVNTRDSLRVGMTEDKTPITTTKITVWQGVDFKDIRSASLLATPVRTSSSLVSTLVSQNPTFVALALLTITL